MFTGLIAGMGRVVAATPVGPELDLDVDLTALPPPIRIGDSIALSGVCCTVVRLQDGVARFRLSEETLRRTRLGTIAPGGLLNLEAAVRAGDPLGGHYVQGHVDGTATLIRPIDPSAGGELVLHLPPDLLRYCVSKGSLAVDGVSLTIASLDEPRLHIAVIPHTAQATNLGTLKAGDQVHIEVDILAKYVEKQMAGALPRAFSRRQHEAGTGDRHQTP